MGLNGQRSEASIEFLPDVAEHVFLLNLAEIQRSEGRNQVVLDDTFALVLKGEFESRRVGDVPPPQLVVAGEGLLALAVGLEVSESQGGIDLLDGHKITFTNPGKYLIVFSIIVSHTTGTNIEHELWFQDDGVDIPSSNTKVEIKDSGGAAVVSASAIITVTGTNYASLRWWCSTTGGRLLATAAGDRPLVPSVLITVNKVSD